MMPTASTATSAENGTVTAKIEMAYLQLRQDILDGVYSANERLVEAPLTEALGISRNTLRTVLARLQHEALVVLEPNRGARVRSFTPEEADDILRVREVVEGLVAALAAERVTKKQIARLRACVKSAEEAIRKDDTLRFTTLSRQFHTDLLEAAGSPAAAAMLDSLHFPIIKYQFQAVLVPGRKQESLSEHRQLLSAIEAHDPKTAERVAREHVRHVRATVTR